MDIINTSLELNINYKNLIIELSDDINKLMRRKYRYENPPLIEYLYLTTEVRKSLNRYYESELLLVP